MIQPLRNQLNYNLRRLTLRGFPEPGLASPNASDAERRAAFAYRNMFDLTFMSRLTAIGGRWLHFEARRS